MAVAHYLDALAWQRDVVEAAHHFRRQEPASQFPGRRRAVRDQHPSRASGPRQGAALSRRRGRHRAQHGGPAERCRTSSSRCASFVDQVYVPDTLAIAGFYKDWGSAGRRHRQFHDLSATSPRKASGDPIYLPDPARRDPQSRPVHHPPDGPGCRRRDPGIRQPLLVQLQRGQGQGPASLQGRDRAATTPARSRLTNIWTWTRIIPG